MQRQAFRPSLSSNRNDLPNESPSKLTMKRSSKTTLAENESSELGAPVMLRKIRQSSCTLTDKFRLDYPEGFRLHDRAMSDLISHSKLLFPYVTDISKLVLFGAEIGKGASGTVRKCTLVNDEDGVFACKTISKAELKQKHETLSVHTEAHVLNELQQHEGVVGLKGLYEDRDEVYFVMEYCEGGDLFTRVKQRRFFSEPEAATICQTLASVLSFCHERGIMHRDLKPENVLFVSKYCDTDVRLADFGSAAFFAPGQKLTELVGSSLYIAPSVLEANYGPEADLWSLGVVLYVILSGHAPFMGRSDKEIFRGIRRGKYDLETRRWKYISGSAKSLVRGLLERDDAKRLTARQVLSHEWIRNPCSCRQEDTEEIPLAKPVLTGKIGWKKSTKSGLKL